MNRGEEKALLHACLEQGRREAVVGEFWDLVARVAQSLLSFYRVPHDRRDVEDLRQETFLRLFADDCRRLRQYDPEKGTGLPGWIKLVASQTVLGELRKNGMMDMKKRNFRLRIEDVAPAFRIDQEDRLDARQMLALTEKAMRRLPEADRRIVEQLYFDCRSLDEIAAAMGKSSEAARVMAYRAKRKILTTIAKMTGEKPL